MSFPVAVYFLCAATSATCAILLGRSYLRTKSSLVFWSSLCFIGLALNNSLLFIDLVLIGPEVSLAMPRTLASFFGMTLLFYGLIVDSP